MYVLSEFDVFNVTQRLIIKKKMSLKISWPILHIYDE